MSPIIKKCINDSEPCIGRDCRDLNGVIKLCCREEIKEEKEIVQNLIDALEDYDYSKHSLQRVSSKLSYAATVINRNNEKELEDVLPVVKRFSLLLYEFQEKILHDRTTSDITSSFVSELKKWFSYRFLQELSSFEHPVHVQSITADINTIEMALGLCMIEEPDESLDDLFF